MTASVFAAAREASFPYTYHGTIEVDILVGGIPSDPNVAKSWLETKVKGVTSDEQIQRLVTETMVERKVTSDEALDIVNKLRNLNGFKKTDRGVLYYEGRQLKAALREAVSVAASVGKIKIQGWGNTRKWIQGFFPEHVFVLENPLPLRVPGKDPNTDEVIDGVWEPASEPTRVLQQFVHTRFGSSIQYQECVEKAQFDFTVVTDYMFSDKDWSMIWTTGEMNGLGASRSQGYGTYRVVKWEPNFNKSAIRALKAEESAQSLDDVPRVRTRAKVTA